MALWKQETGLHPTFAAINRCLEDDWFLLPFELLLQRGHARALRAAELLSEAELRAIEAGVATIESKYLAAPCPESDAEDLHTWLEGLLTELAGDAGRKIHTARSRNDQVATLIKLFLIDAGGRIEELLGKLTEIACRRADGWAELACPMQTHQQFAAPGSMGFWVLRYAAAFDRLREQMKASVSTWNRYCPLGSGAVAGSSISIDRRIQARELGFEQPSLNALDSTSCRDECLDLLALAAKCALQLQTFAFDVICFSQTGLGWTKYPAEFATGSSMMPNKSNPDAMELLRGECCSIESAHGEAILLLKGLASGYNRDLQCIKPLIRRTVEKLAAMLQMTAAFLERLEFNPERLTESLAQGEIGATLFMEQLVKDGRPLRDAHHGVAAELAQGRHAACAPDSIQAYQTIGSASPGETRRISAEIRDRLSKERKS